VVYTTAKKKSQSLGEANSSTTLKLCLEPQKQEGKIVKRKERLLKNGLPLFGCTVRVEWKFIFNGAHVLKLSGHRSEGSWACSLEIVKLQNSPDLNQNIPIACALYLPSINFLVTSVTFVTRMPIQIFKYTTAY